MQNTQQISQNRNILLRKHTQNNNNYNYTQTQNTNSSSDEHYTQKHYDKESEKQHGNAPSSCISVQKKTSAANEVKTKFILFYIHFIYKYLKKNILLFI